MESDKRDLLYAYIGFLYTKSQSSLLDAKNLEEEIADLESKIDTLQLQNSEYKKMVESINADKTRL
jgi:uncharacterized coiled-coil DUF342 family protein